ncbi:MAG: succinate dehydrogenase/fumarate reductase iron-sulfur subunit [Clostridia bacterium]|nr:succinate dehydrogenase/fumarate reductase iron-sulfur subunit [Clostridia bacterium]
MPEVELTVRVLRGLARPSAARGGRYESYTLPADADWSLLDVLEALQAGPAPDLMYRHSCHHASCGTCALRVDGRDRLACLTTVGQIAAGKLRERSGHGKDYRLPEGARATVTLEPLRNFPVMGDLAVDFGEFYGKLDAVDADLVAGHGEDDTHFEHCITCGACMSACPIVASDLQYLGPAPLALALRGLKDPTKPGDDDRRLAAADQPHGVWRCHHVFECTAACPAGVDPGQALMELRAHLVRRHLGLAEGAKR